MKKRIFAIFLSLALVLSFMPAMTFTSSAYTTPVSYVDKNGTTKTCTNYTELYSLDLAGWSTWGSDGVETWLVFPKASNGPENFSPNEKFRGEFSGVTVKGKVNLILMDGYTLEIQGAPAIKIADGATLTIYSQAGGTGTLNVRGDLGCNAPDGNDEYDGGNGEDGKSGFECDGTGSIIINGGTITTNGGAGGDGGNGKTTTSGGNGGNGGSGFECNGTGSITINGGTITVNGGNAGSGGDGGDAGNGGNAGNSGSGFECNGAGSITINGGTITARIGSAGTLSYGGAAWGNSGKSGDYISCSDNCTTTITGGTFNFDVTPFVDTVKYNVITNQVDPPTEWTVEAIPYLSFTSTLINSALGSIFVSIAAIKGLKWVSKLTTLKFNPFNAYWLNLLKPHKFWL